ncbi:MAG: PD-(D/E)XK nuclease family protein [Thermoanaerobaculia bacterium]|nr:PD-(D/E)XK nuclease family protein [Thermoanaerobaculia bacterium]
MSMLLSRLSKVCRAHLLREKILVVPSLAIGHQIADAVAHAGTSWVNLRIETLRTLADGVAGFALAHEGTRVLSRAQALALIERACDRVLDSSSYFAELAERPGLHRAIQKSIDDLRHSGIEASSLASVAFEDPRKARDLTRILEAYEEDLVRGRYVDRFGVLRRATEMAASVPKGGDRLWFVVADLELTTAEERFLQMLAVEWETLGGEADQPDVTTEIRRAIGEENEIRGAFRTILDSGTPFDAAEIVYTSRASYLPLAFELSAEYGVPCTFAEGIAAHFTRPGQAVLAFLRWIGEGWQASEIQRMGSGSRIARVMRAAAIGWGRDRYLPRIDALIADRRETLAREADETRRAIHENAIADATAARELIEGLLEITRDVPATKAAAAFVARFAKVKNDVDVMAREGLRRMFTELAAVETPGAPPAQWAARLAEAVRNLHVAASNPRPGHLHVAPIRSGAWSGRANLFVAGLDEEKHPGRGLQDPILLDTERESMGIPLSGDRVRRTSQQFTSLLARAAGSSARATLSWPTLRIRDRREQFPSAALLDAFRSATRNAGATYDELIAAAREDRLVDPRALTVSENALRRALAGDASVVGEYPMLVAGAEAEVARDSSEITKWDGKINASAEELDPRLNGRTYSASQLEKLASCPYRHFLERVLRVTPIEELVFDPDTWLDARDFGTLVHETFELAMKELTTTGARPSLAFLPRMDAIAREALERWRREIPPPSDSAFDRRARDLIRSCEVFLRTEELAGGDAIPQHFEFAFDDFELPLGNERAIRLRGFIDRIDRDEARDEWHVWDYKTGLPKDFEGNWRLKCGTKIQHALYARAVEATLGGKVTKSGYLFPTPRGRGIRIERQCTDTDLQRALNLLSDVVASGWFPHTNDCRWCDFQSICGGYENAAERTRIKLNANDSDPAVIAWNTLQRID